MNWDLSLGRFVISAIWVPRETRVDVLPGVEWYYQRAPTWRGYVLRVRRQVITIGILARLV